VLIEQSSIAASRPPVRIAVAADDDGLAAALVRAFREDALLNWAFRTGAGRERGWGVYFRTALELYRGSVFALPSALGCGIWVAPDKWRLSLGRELLLAPRILKMLGWRRLVRGLGAVKKMEAQHPSELHYYLQVLGVDPSLQGQGIGSQLLAAGLERVDDDRLAVFLETSNQRNLPLYRRHGFEVQRTYDFGPGSPTMFAMWRPARK
jgi:ribosomal protein S18 acetylase RimI-like enzyme